MAWDKAVKVGKVERYTYGLSEWLNGEAITSASVTCDNVFASVSAVNFDNDEQLVSFLATGVQAGTQQLRIDFATATRSDTSPILKLKVKALPAPV